MDLIEKCRLTLRNDSTPLAMSINKSRLGLLHSWPDPIHKNVDPTGRCFDAKTQDDIPLLNLFKTFSSAVKPVCGNKVGLIPQPSCANKIMILPAYKFT